MEQLPEYFLIDSSTECSRQCWYRHSKEKNISNNEGYEYLTKTKNISWRDYVNVASFSTNLMGSVRVMRELTETFRRQALESISNHTRQTNNGY